MGSPATSPEGFNRLRLGGNLVGHQRYVLRVELLLRSHPETKPIVAQIYKSVDQKQNSAYSDPIQNVLNKLAYPHLIEKP